MLGLGLSLTRNRGFTPQEVGPVYQGLNAADPVNEVSGTANTSVHIGTPTWSVGTTSPAPHNGAAYLKLTHNGPENSVVAGFVAAKGVLSGQNVTITFRMYDSNSLTRWQARLHADDGWTVTSANANPAQQVWDTVVLTGTANQNDPQIEFFTTTSADAGDFVGVDTISIVVNS